MKKQLLIQRLRAPHGVCWTLSRSWETCEEAVFSWLFVTSRLSMEPSVQPLSVPSSQCLGYRTASWLATGRKGRSQHGRVHLYMNPRSHLYLSICRRGAVSTRPDLCWNTGTFVAVLGWHQLQSACWRNTDMEVTPVQLWPLWPWV